METINHSVNLTKHGFDELIRSCVMEVAGIPDEPWNMLV